MRNSEILLRLSVTLFAHFLQCHKMYLRLLGCLSYKVTPHTVSIEYALRNYLWYDSSSCSVGWVGNFQNGCKWIVSIRAVVALLEGALPGFISPCRAFRRHFCHRHGRESQSLCFDTRGWQPFVVIPIVRGYTTANHRQNVDRSPPVLCVFFLHFRFLTSSMSFPLCMFLVPVNLVMSIKSLRSDNRTRWFRYTKVSDTAPWPLSGFVLSSPLFPQHIYSCFNEWHLLSVVWYSVVDG